MIKELEKEFTKKNIRYSQIYKNKDGWTLYQCYDTNFDYSYYEVFKHKIVKVDEFKKSLSTYKDYDEYEVYPSDEHFGNLAFCCSNFDRVKAMISKHST